jgi:dynein heavy chain
LDEFTTKGPFVSSIQTGEALENISAIRAQMEALKKQEADIRRGLNIFKIDQPPSKEIAALDKVKILKHTNTWLYSNLRIVLYKCNL